MCHVPCDGCPIHGGHFAVISIISLTTMPISHLPKEYLVFRPDVHLPESTALLVPISGPSLVKSPDWSQCHHKALVQDDRLWFVVPSVMTPCSHFNYKYLEVVILAYHTGPSLISMTVKEKVISAEGMAVSRCYAYNGNCAAHAALSCSCDPLGNSRTVTASVDFNP